MDQGAKGSRQRRGPEMNGSRLTAFLAFPGGLWCESPHLLCQLGRLRSQCRQQPLICGQGRSRLSATGDVYSLREEIIAVAHL